VGKAAGPFAGDEEPDVREKGGIPPESFTGVLGPEDEREEKHQVIQGPDPQPAADVECLQPIGAPHLPGLDFAFEFQQGVGGKKAAKHKKQCDTESREEEFLGVEVVDHHNPHGKCAENIDLGKTP
jgi:hypothetical protein